MIRHIPLDEATTPRTGECIANSWWAHHPGQGLIFAGQLGTSPQCNIDRRITDQLTRAMYPNAEVIKVDVVYLGYVRDQS